ncbi:hypothetical protein BDZ89DRAFT_121648 [Hymenopellis radicata]|nr:hypothetical protein BDZ89DRAFT_121648 [Hymenopellis radicata]
MRQTTRLHGPQRHPLQRQISHPTTGYSMSSVSHSVHYGTRRRLLPFLAPSSTHHHGRPVTPPPLIGRQRAACVRTARHRCRACVPFTAGVEILCPLILFIVDGPVDVQPSCPRRITWQESLASTSTSLDIYPLPSRPCRLLLLARHPPSRRAPARACRRQPRVVRLRARQHRTMLR